MDSRGWRINKIQFHHILHLLNHYVQSVLGNGRFSGQDHVSADQLRTLIFWQLPDDIGLAV